MDFWGLILLMEIFLKIRNAVHGWSEETRKFLAMLTMGIGLLVFFSLWISSVSSRLVAIGPSAPPAGLTAQGVPSSPTAFLPFDDVGGNNPVGAPPTAPPSGFTQNNVGGSVVAQEQAPTPIQGVAETFAGLNQLFSRTADQPSDTIEGKLRSIGARLWGIVLNIFSWAQDFLLWFGGWLYAKVSTIIAS